MNRIDEFIEAISRGPSDEGMCQECGSLCSCPSDLEPTPLCNLCAQELASLVPEIILGIDAKVEGVPSLGSTAGKVQLLKEAAVVLCNFLEEQEHFDLDAVSPHVGEAINLIAAVKAGRTVA